MPAGRKAKPRHLKILEGNPGKRALKDEPRPTPRPPKPPTWLSKEAAAEWKRLVPELDRVGLLTLVDRAALAAYCEAWSTHKEAVGDVKRNGIKLEIERERFSRNGDSLGVDVIVVPNPAVKVQKEMASLMRGYMAEFGLTPYSRSRLSPPELEEDAAEKIMTPNRAQGPR